MSNNEFQWGDGFVRNADKPYQTVSPLTKAIRWEYIRYTSTEIEEQFFPSATPIQLSSSAIAIVEPDCVSDIIPVELNFGYTKNAIRNIIYNIKIYISTDGLKIKEIWECPNVFPNEKEILVFIENNIDDWSSQKIYTKFGSKVNKKELEADLDEKDFNFIRSATNLTDLDSSLIKEIFTKNEVTTNVSATRSFLYLLFEVVGTIAKPVKFLGDFFKNLGEVITHTLSLPESIWDTDADNYIGKKQNLIKALQISSNTLNSIEVAINSIIQPTEINIIGGALTGKISTTSMNVINFWVKEYNGFIESIINDYYDDIAGLFQLADKYIPLSEYIAFLCGIWNGLVDFIGGVIQFIGAILSAPSDIAVDFDTSLEIFDNFCEALRKFSIKNFWNAISQSWESAKAYFTEQSASLNTDKVAYAFGYSIAFVATFFIPFTQFTKIANLSKIGKSILPGKMIEEISAGIAKGRKVITDTGKTITDESIRVLRSFIALLGKGTEELIAFFEKVWKTIADWFLKNKKALDDLKKFLQKAFNKDSKSDELFRDIFKKFVVNNKGRLTQRQFLKIAKQIEKHFGTKLYWIDRNSKEFASLFKKWKEDPIFAMFHLSTFKNGRYGITLKGPSIYFFNGYSKLGHRIEITAYSLQHELIHLKLWYKMTKELPELSSIYKSIPRWLDEANVIGEILIQNAQKVGKWSMNDIINDLEVLNNIIRRNPNFRKDVKSIFGKEYLEISDLENWNIGEVLKKYKL